MSDEQLENLMKLCNSDIRLPTEYEIIEMRKKKKKLQQTENNLTKSD